MASVKRRCLQDPYDAINFLIRRKIKATQLKDLSLRLDHKDMISIIFLLTDKHADLFEVTNSLKSGCYSKFFKLYYENEWKFKLVETLLLIKNIDVIRNVLNFDKNEIEKLRNYFDDNTNLNHIIKKLFLLCESLDTDEVKNLACEINTRLDPSKQMDENNQILEIHLLHLLQQKFISIDEEYPNLTNLIACLEKIKCTDVLPLIDEHTENLCVSWIGEHKKLCIIINIINFTDHTISRSSSKEDEKRLKETFLNLNFEVEEPYQDLTEEEMLILLDSLEEPQYSDYGCIFMFLLSHGTKGKVLFSDLKKLSIKTIETKFCCENLKNVFKFLILQSCQGNLKGVIDLNSDAGENIDSSDGLECDDPLDDNNVFANPMPSLHFGLFLATIEDFVAWRDPIKGSWFINDICDSLQLLTKPTKVSDWVTEVKRRVCNRRDNSFYKNKNCVQIPKYTCHIPVQYILPRYGKTL